MSPERRPAALESTVHPKGLGPTTPYDAVAHTYESVRPGYPTAVFDAIAEYADLRPGARVLEVGAGTGQATRQLSGMGWQVDVIEPGADLITVAEANESSEAVRFHNSRFEDARVNGEEFDLVVAATSWHWIDPSVSYRKAHDALRPGGSLALLWNAHVPDTPRSDWVPIRQAYLEVVPELADLAPLTPDRPDYDPVAELNQCGFFHSIEERTFPFEITYSADRFLALLDTYASHAGLDARRREELHHRLRFTIRDVLGGQVIKPYRAVLVLGRRAD